MLWRIVCRPKKMPIVRCPECGDCAELNKRGVFECKECGLEMNSLGIVIEEE